MRTRVRAAGGWLLRHRAHTGLAQVYAAVVLVVAILVATLPGGERLVADSSTNLHNLRHDPLLVLGASAFVVSPVWGLWLLPVLIAVYGAAQRWIGAAATAIAAAFGHVGATLMVAVLLAAGITDGHLDPGLTEAPDVGVSYGLVTVAALLTARVRHRVWYAAILVGYCLIPALFDPDFTAVGHLVSAGIGFGLALLIQRGGMRLSSE